MRLLDRPFWRRQEETYREEDDGNSEGDSSEHGHTHAQNQRVVRVDPAVGVKQLRLHFT